MKLAFTILIWLVISCTSRATAKTLPFIKDDYSKALSDAKQRHLPLFVEVWAPW
jgi:hypothetical protein